jgi:hypothetical protein
MTYRSTTEQDFRFFTWVTCRVRDTSKSFDDSFNSGIIRPGLASS